MNVIYSSSFYKDLKKIPVEYLEKVSIVVREIISVHSVLKIKDCKKLQGKKNVYRIRLNDYRIIFILIKVEDTVKLQRILLRGQAYKKGILSDEGCV